MLKGMIRAATLVVGLATAMKRRCAKQDHGSSGYADPDKDF